MGVSSNPKYLLSGMHLQEEAREAVASPVEAIADSLDEHADQEEKGGGKLTSAIQGEFGEYDFDETQLKVTASSFSGDFVSLSIYCVKL